MSNRLSILIVAHEFSPSQGSECAVGWNLVMHLAKYHDLTVLYARTNQFNTSDYENSVKKYFESHQGISGLKLIPVEQPEITKFFVRINSISKPRNSAIGFAPLYYIGYRFWQKSVFRKAKELILIERYHIAHQLTSISFREPGYLWKLKVPFVWGPCSGLVRIPSSYYGIMKLKDIIPELFRRISNFLQSRFSPRIRHACKKASVIFPVSPDDQNFFMKYSKARIHPLLDVGTYSSMRKLIYERRKVNTDNKLRLIWIGRIQYTKALSLLLLALVKNRILTDRTELTIIGDGPDLIKETKLAERHGLLNITWMGNISHDKVFEELRRSDVLVHTSIKEATSAVILEALTCGLPVICHDAFGMGIAINSNCGIKIDMTSPEKSIQGFSEAISKLEADRDLLGRLSDGAFNRASELSWESLSQQISGEYLEVLKSANIISEW